MSYHFVTGRTELAYSAEGIGILLNGGFDLSPADGALAILATR